MGFFVARGERAPPGGGYGLLVWDSEELPTLERRVWMEEILAREQMATRSFIEYTVCQTEPGQTALQVGPTVTSILQKRMLKHRVIKHGAQDHTAFEWQTR